MIGTKGSEWSKNNSLYFRSIDIRSIKNKYGVRDPVMWLETTTKMMIFASRKLISPVGYSCGAGEIRYLVPEASV